MRLPLIILELVPACGMLAAIVLIAPGESSKTYALVMIITGVLPGLLLTGDVKLLVAGADRAASRLKLKVAVALIAGIPVAAAGIGLQPSDQSLPLLILFFVLGTIGAIAQAFSPVWYYTQADKTRLQIGKTLSACTRLGFSAAAIAASELAVALVGIAAGAIVEFGMNWRTLAWQSPRSASLHRQVLSMLGVAYGVSRIVSAGVRVGLSQLFGPLIASFLLIEQLMGGINSLFEKYFARSTRWRSGVRAAKVIYLGSMTLFVPMLAATELVPEDRSALIWLTVLACAGMLPLAEMYSALQHKGQTVIAVGSTAISLACAILIAIAWQLDVLPWASLVAYVLLPGATFIFYWILSIDARHNTQR